MKQLIYVKKTKEIDDLLTSKKYIKLNDCFNYLIKMPMDSVNEENVKKLMDEKELIENKLKKLNETTTETMWFNELSVIENYLKKGL